MTNPAEKTFTLRFCVSSIRIVYVAVLAVMLAMSIGCGVRDKSGKCKDYEPMDFCPEDTVYLCDVSEDGCKQCGCVPAQRPGDD